MASPTGPTIHLALATAVPKKKIPFLVGWKKKLFETNQIIIGYILRTDSRVQKPAIRRLVGPNVKTYW